MKRQTFANSVLREEWDSDARTYTRWDENGVQVVQRSFTADETTTANAEAAAAAVASNESDLRVQLGAGPVFDNLRTVANGSGVFATNAARDAAIRTCARALVILVRLSLRRLDATD